MLLNTVYYLAFIAAAMAECRIPTTPSPSQSTGCLDTETSTSIRSAYTQAEAIVKDILGNLVALTGNNNTGPDRLALLDATAQRTDDLTEVFDQVRELVNGKPIMGAACTREAVFCSAESIARYSTGIQEAINAAENKLGDLSQATTTDETCTTVKTEVLQILNKAICDASKLGQALRDCLDKESQ